MNLCIKKLCEEVFVQVMFKFIILVRRLNKVLRKICTCRVRKNVLYKIGWKKLCIKVKVVKRCAEKLFEKMSTDRRSYSYTHIIIIKTLFSCSCKVFEIKSLHI